MKKVLYLFLVIVLLTPMLIFAPTEDINAKGGFYSDVYVSITVGETVDLEDFNRIEYAKLDYDQQYYYLWSGTKKFSYSGSLKNFKWETNNSKKVQIASSGLDSKIKGKKAGKAKVYLKRRVDDSIVCTFHITVKEKEYKLNAENIAAIKNQKFKLKLINYKKKTTWSSSDENIAEVSDNGKVTCKLPGECVITAETKTAKYNCSVKVLEEYDVKKLISYSKKLISSDAYITKSSFYDTEENVYIGDYTDYKYEKYFLDCLKKVGMPTDAWSSIDYIISTKVAKEIKKKDVKAGDFVIWYSNSGSFYIQPKLVTKVDKDGTIYVADLNGQNIYAPPCYYDYRPSRYNTLKKMWKSPPKMDYEIRYFRFNL